MHKRWKEYWVSMDEVRKEKEIKKIVTPLFWSLKRLMMKVSVLIMAGNLLFGSVLLMPFMVLRLLVVGHPKVFLNARVTING